MRHVVVVSIVAVAVAVAAAATTFIQVSQGQAASLEQGRIQHEELTRRLDRLEQLVAGGPRTRAG